MTTTALSCSCRHERRQHRQGKGRCLVASCSCLYAPTPAAERATAEVPTIAFNALTEGVSQAQIVCCFSVPGEPARKMRPQFNMRQGRAFTPEATVQAEQRVRDYMKTVYPRLDPVSEYVGLVLRFYLKGVGRADLSNMVKLVEDSMNGVTYVDDKQIRKIDAQLIDNCSQRRTDVLVYRLGKRLL